MPAKKATKSTKADAMPVGKTVSEGEMQDLGRAVLGALMPLVPTVVIYRDPPNPDRIKTMVTHQMFHTALTAIQRTNIMLVGPAGCGKTKIGEQIADAIGKPFYFNGAIDSAYKLSGFIDAQGRYVSTPFRQAFEEGGVYLFDEVDGSMPSAILAFNAALSNGFADFPDARVDRHPDFYCMAAANTYGTGADRIYVGRNQLDGATLDRFAVIPIDYDPKLEDALCKNIGWRTQVRKWRQAVADLKIRHIISTRAIVDGAKLIEAGLSADEVASMVVWRGLDPESVAKVTRYAEKPTSTKKGSKKGTQDMDVDLDMDADDNGRRW